ncbi:MAG: EamA family transporter [Firmicutes bacterium]|nr:EamA family transporter [Bacillota bacterium]
MLKGWPMFLGVFISSISQVMLKLSAQKQYDNKIKEYLNPLVIGGYAIFFAATLMSILAYKSIPLSMGGIIEATGYIYITLWGVSIFREKINKGKLAALALIISGIIIYSL